MWGRRIIIGAVAWLMLTAQAGERAEPQGVGKGRSEQTKAAEQPAKGAPPGAREALPFVKAVDRPLENRPCKPFQDNRESDLCAQWKAADAASRAVWWAMVGTLVAALGTAGLYWQIALTRKAVQDTGEATKAMSRSNQIMEEGQRPWIVLEPRITTYNYGHNIFGMTVVVKFKNFGRTVAASYRPFLRIVFAGENFFDPINPLRNELTEPSPNFGHILAPGDTDEVIEKNNWTIDSLPWFGAPPRVHMIVLASARYRVAGYEGSEGRKHQKLTFNTFLVGNITQDVVRRRWIYKDELVTLNPSVLGLTPNIPEEAC